MKFAFIPRQNVKIHQIIKVNGQKMKVISYSHTGKNCVAVTLDKAPRFEKILCIFTDAESIVELS